uniref:Uncharacterized protein n=1 Tax=Anguilla anguilla TaxID=7936 RepID=A0A0E9WKB1_ANGAN
MGDQIRYAAADQAFIASLPVKSLNISVALLTIAYHVAYPSKTSGHIAAVIIIIIIVSYPRKLIA